MSKKVDVYRNLKTGTYSLRLSGKVVAHPETLVLRDVKFVVQPAGYRRTRLEHQRCVHAFLRGLLDDESCPVEPPPGAVRITYRPFSGPPSFITESGDPVSQAERVYCFPQGQVWGINVC